MGQSRFLDGLLWGMIIGGTAVFLLGTKKGKKLLDIITEEGAEGLNQVLREIETEMEDVENEVAPDFDEEEQDIITKKLEKTSADSDSAKPKAKRFFSSKKS